MLLIPSISFLVLLQITGVTTARATEPVSWSDTRFGGGSDTQFSSDGYADVTSISISGDGQYRAYVRKYESVMYSKDGGVTFNNISDEVRGQNTLVAISNDGSQILVAYSKAVSIDAISFEDVILMISSDHGVSWRRMNTTGSGAPIGPFSAITVSNNGEKIAITSSIGSLTLAEGYGGSSTTNHKLFISGDGGLTWVEKQSRSESWIKFDSQLAASADGSKIIWTTPQGTVLRSVDAGVTWADTGLRGQSLDMSSNGEHIIVGYSKYWSNSSGQHLEDKLYASHDFGSNFSLVKDVFATFTGVVGSAIEIHWVQISDDGNTIIFETDEGFLGGRPAHVFYSIDRGANFAQISYPQELGFLMNNALSSIWAGISLSSNGNILILNNYNVLRAASLSTPSAPATISALVGNAQATVTWAVPSSNPSLIDYVIQYSSNNGYTWSTVVSPSVSVSSGSASATITGLSNGTGYLFRVSGRNAWGYGNYAKTSTALTPGYLPWSARNIATTAGDSSIVVSWENSYWDGDSPITGYQVEYSTNYSTWTKFPSSGLLNSPVTITGLNNGTSYFVRITSVNNVGSGTPVKTSQYTPIVPKTSPGKSSTPTATYSGSNINLTWSAPTSNGGVAITDYVYEYSTNAGSSWSTFTHTASTSTNVTISGLPGGAVYIFRVSAKNAVGTGVVSDNSSPAAVAPSAPAAPTGIYADGTVTLSWSAPSTGGAAISDYLIQYSSNGGTNWSTFSHTASVETTITVDSLVNGTSYIFRVAAINIVGTGLNSANSLSITPSGLPGTPTSVSATASSQAAAVTWSAPSANGASISDYKIEYSTDAGSTWTTYSHTASTSTSATITGLTNYLAYIFRISAKNANGFGEASSTSTAVNPGSTVASISLSTVASGAKNGVAFTTQPVVTLKDGNSATITTDSASVVIASVSSGGTLIGTKQVTASSGVATFSNLGLNGVPGTAYTLSFTTAGFTDTQTVTAVIGDPYKLALTTVGVGGQAGVSFSTQPVVKIQDIAGTIITTDSTSLVTATTATANCYTSNREKTAASGVATYTDFAITGTAGTSCVISYDSSGLISATQSTTITPGPKRSLTKIKTTDGGSWPGVYGRSLTEQPVYKITDSGGNTLTGDNSTVVTVTGPAGSTVTQQNATAVNGIVTFDHLGFTGVSLGYNSFSVSYVGLITPTSDSADIAKGDPVLSWSGITKKTTDPNFTITAPTVNTPGSFSYTSGSASVLTISGSTATIVGPGTCVVTATFTPTDTVKFNSGVTETMTVTVTQGFTITTTADSHSTITASAGIETGTSKTVTFSGNTGYEITGITLDSVVLNGTTSPKLADLIAAGSYTFSNVIGNHSISVTSTLKSYSITASSSSGGSISNSGSSTVNHGSSSALYSFTASSGYQLNAILIDGVPLSSSTTPTLSDATTNGYTFLNVDASHEISVSYSLIPVTSYTVTTTPDSHSTITASATIKKLVWNTNIGEDIGKTKCLCCKSTDITQLSFNCGHIIAEANGGETIVSPPFASAII